MVAESEEVKSSLPLAPHNELAIQLNTLSESTTRTLWIYVGCFILALTCLFVLSFFSILPPEPVRAFDPAKEALFFEKYESVIIEYKHARGLLEITDKGTISRIRDHIRSLEAEWPIQRIKQEIEAGGWGGGEHQRVAPKCLE